MCYPEKCPHCGKTGWAGCGKHVDDVMKAVPRAQRCTCARTSLECLNGNPAFSKEDAHDSCNVDHYSRLF